MKLKNIAIISDICLVVTNCAAYHMKLCDKASEDRREEYLNSNSLISKDVALAIKAKKIMIGMTEEELRISIGINEECNSLNIFSPFILPDRSWEKAYQPFAWPTPNPVEFGAIITRELSNEKEDTEKTWVRSRNGVVVEYGIGSPCRE